MKLMELKLAGRPRHMLEGKLAAAPYAYRRARSAEAPLPDLDRFATDRQKDKRVTSVVGPDAAGAIGSAGLVGR